MEGKPIQTTVSDLLRYNTDLLLFYLEKELRLDLEKHREQLHWLTLEQIFIENRLYKNIEECPTWKDVVKTTENSLQPFLKKLPRKLTTEDVEKLLTLKIRRISRFDIEKNRSDIRKTKAAIRKTKSFLEDITRYTISFLEDLLEKYGERYPRRTNIETFSGIKTQEVAIRNLRLSCDTDKGFIGTGVKGEVSLPVSEFDRTVIFFSNGVYKIISVEDKVFVDTNVVHFDVYDRKHVFTSVYRQKDSRIAYIKRFTIGGFILGKEYRFFPEEDEILYFTGEQDIRLEYWFERKKRQKTHKDSTLLSDVRIGGAAAHGKRLAGKKVISSIKGVLLGEEDKTEEEAEAEEDFGGENSDSDSIPKDIGKESEAEGEEETASDTTTIENDISELAEEAIRQAEKVHRIVETIETSPREASPRKQDSEESDLFGDLEE
jgi:topoisomerase-4 subunit A